MYIINIYIYYNILYYIYTYIIYIYITRSSSNRNGHIPFIYLVSFAAKGRDAPWSGEAKKRSWVFRKRRYEMTCPVIVNRVVVNKAIVKLLQDPYSCITNLGWIYIVVKPFWVVEIGDGLVGKAQFYHTRAAKRPSAHQHMDGLLLL